MFDSQTGILTSFRWLTPVLVFLSICSSPVFSAEDINQLIAQGAEALALGNHDQVSMAAKKILEQDPRDINGYKLAMSYCVITGRETAFYLLIEEAIERGIPELAIDKMAAELLFLGKQASSAGWMLLEYEEKWRQLHDRDS